MTVRGASPGAALVESQNRDVAAKTPLEYGASALNRSVTGIDVFIAAVRFMAGEPAKPW
ncbi:MAG: hypothetical protein R6U98_01440 [Pirellulaceae bacterium]